MRSYSARKLVPPTMLSVRIVTKCRITVCVLNIIVGSLSPAFRKIIRLKKILYECFSWFFPGSGSPRDHQRGVRSDDSNGLLTKGLEYIDEKHGALIPPISASRPKADVRGFNHPMIMQFLCPIDYIALFNQDPEGYAPSFVLHLILLFFLQILCQTLKRVHQDS